MIISQLSFKQFSSIDYIRKLSLREQLGKYNEYIENDLREALFLNLNHDNYGVGGIYINPTLQCLSSLEFIVQYSGTLGPCPGGHTCDAATFYLRANTTIVGTVYLSNTGGVNDQYNYPPGETSGNNRYSSLTLTSNQIQDIASASQDGNISLSLICATPADIDYGWGLGQCHTNVSWITLKLNGATIYSDCPDNNFLTINPCTGIIS